MKIFPVLTAAFAITAVFSSPAMAENPGKLSFSDLEFGMPMDPLLWSSTPIRAEQHTPAADMTYAVSQLRSAVPVGLSASEARERLQAAGSRCDMTDPSTITCRYKDVQTPDSEYVDDVVWKVTVPLVGGQVADLKVIRNWYRR